MNKLLSANFARLKKDIPFRIGMAFMLVVGIARPISTYYDRIRWNYMFTFESSFFVYVIFMATLSSVFCSLFIGTEYSNGTIRNKLIVGHKRCDVYLSNLILCLAASFFMCAAYLIPNFCIGFPLLGTFTIPFHLALGKMGCIFILSIALASIFTVVSMLSQSKSTSAVICILGVFLLMFTGIILSSRLSEPEFYSNAFFMTDEGIILNDTASQNPAYVEGFKRDVYEFLLDFLPGGQIIQLSSDTDKNLPLGKMSLYSILIAITAGGLGIRFFHKKDIK